MGKGDQKTIIPFQQWLVHSKKKLNSYNFTVIIHPINTYNIN